MKGSTRIPTHETMPQVRNGSGSGMSRATILTIEADEDVRALVRNVVERAGMTSVDAAEGADGLRRFWDTRPDLVLLDVELPGPKRLGGNVTHISRMLGGWEILRRIREVSDTPVVILSTVDHELETVRGLREGADDYIIKPCGRHELLARVEAVLRRSERRDPQARVYADDFIEIDFPQRAVRALDTEVALTPTEFKLLSVFARHPRQVLSRDQLGRLVWQDDHGTSSQRVKLYVSYLRQKLGRAGVDPVETVRGFGYRYRPRRISQPSGAGSSAPDGPAS